MCVRLIAVALALAPMFTAGSMVASADDFSKRTITFEMLE